MAELSQFLNTGSVKTVSVQEGSVDTTTTGVKLTVTATSTQKVILTPQVSGPVPTSDTTFAFGGRNVYTGTAGIFRLATETDMHRHQSLVGGKGEDLTITVNTAGSGVINYFVQVVEID